MVKRIITMVLCCSLITIFSPLSGSSPAQAAEKGQTKDSNTAGPEASPQLTASHLFKVSYTTEPAQIPLNAFHSWTLTVRTTEGTPVTDAEIEVSGGMPAHGHGLQSTPKVTKNFGNGTYLIEGIKFFMPGQWVMNFVIKADGKEDKVAFPVDL